MTAEDLDALAADMGRNTRGHDCCDLDCEDRQRLELASGYLSLRLVQADHERQIDGFKKMQEAYRLLLGQYSEKGRQMAALQAAYDDVQAAYLRVCGAYEEVRPRGHIPTTLQLVNGHEPSCRASTCDGPCTCF